MEPREKIFYCGLFVDEDGRSDVIKGFYYPGVRDQNLKDMETAVSDEKLCGYHLLDGYTTTDRTRFLKVLQQFEVRHLLNTKSEYDDYIVKLTEKGTPEDVLNATLDCQNDYLNSQMEKIGRRAYRIMRRDENYEPCEVEVLCQRQYDEMLKDNQQRMQQIGRHDDRYLAYI